MTDATANFTDMATNEATPKTEKDKNKEVTDSLQTFETRWRYAVFPAMVLFVLLIGFMFYLIYGMLQRMEDLSKDIHQMSKVITASMPKLEQSVSNMAVNIGDMKVATTSIAITTHGMGQNIWDINRNISKPLSVMNKILPWSYKGNQSRRPPPNFQTATNVSTMPAVNTVNYQPIPHYYRPNNKQVPVVPAQIMPKYLFPPY